MAALTIGENDGVVIHSVSGASTGPFAFDFAYFLAAEVIVTKTTAAGVLSTLTNGVDYTLTGTAADDGYSAGSITLAVAVSSCLITIRRSLVLSKATNLAVTGRVPMAAINTLFSRLMSVAQDFTRENDLALKFPAGEIGIENEMPAAVLRASKYAGFDSLGNFALLTSPVLTTAVSAAMAPVIIAATLALARTALGVGTGDIVDAQLADMVGPSVKGRSSGTGAPQSILLSALQALLTPRGQAISGLTYSNGTDATNDINVAAGGCMDSTGAEWISIAATTKQSDAVWAADNGATPTGGLDLIGSAGNNPFYLFAIKNPTTQVSGVLMSLSATSPTLPTGYTLFRRFGWFRRVGGTIVAFNTYETEGGGLSYEWEVPTLDVDLTSTLTTARRTDAAKVPLNISTTAILDVLVFDAASVFAARLCCPDETDAAPSISAAPLANFYVNTAGDIDMKRIAVRTSAAGLVAARANLATVDAYRFCTVGFIDARR